MERQSINMIPDQFAWLGVPDATFDTAAWGQYIQSLRDNVEGSWQRAVGAYKTLKAVREQLGLPFIVDAQPGGEGQPPTPPPPGAWTSDFEQQMLDLQGIVSVLVKAADEAVEGKRKLAWNEQIQDFVLESLPGDQVRIEMVGGKLVATNLDGSGAKHWSGTVGEPAQLGALPAIAWVAITGISVVGIYFITDRVCKAVETAAEEKTFQTTATKNAELVQSGKATPEQATAMTSAVYKGAAELHKAKAKEKSQEAPSQFAGTVKMLAWAGLGIAGIYLASKVIGASGSSGAQAAPALMPNPSIRRKVGNIGDVNPIEYGGGFVFKNEYGYFVEYTHGMESDCPDVEKLSRCELALYSVPVPDDVFSDHDWVKVEEVARTIGADPEELRKAGSSNNVMERVRALEDIASHWGWNELDHYPQTVKASELKRRWRV